MLAYVLKYLKGSIFLNSYASSVAEFFGKLSTVIVLKHMSIKRVFLTSFSLSLIGVFLLILFRNTDAIIPVLVLITRFAFS